jgi:hypothetical protein
MRGKYVSMIGHEALLSETIVNELSPGSRKAKHTVFVFEGLSELNLTMHKWCKEVVWMAIIDVEY